MLPPQCGARGGRGALLAPAPYLGCTAALGLWDLRLNLAAVWADQVGFLGPGLRAEAQHPTRDSWTRTCRPALLSSPTALGWAAHTWGGRRRRPRVGGTLWARDRGLATQTGPCTLGTAVSVSQCLPIPLSLSRLSPVAVAMQKAAQAPSSQPGPLSLPSQSTGEGAWGRTHRQAENTPSSRAWPPILLPDQMKPLPAMPCRWPPPYGHSAQEPDLPPLRS